LAGLPPAVLANARDVLARLERYELEVFSDDEKIVTGEELAKAAGVSANTALDRATARAGRRKAAAQASLFDLGNQIGLEEIRDVDQENLSPGEAKELLRKLRARIV